MGIREVLVDRYVLSTGLSATGGDIKILENDMQLLVRHQPIIRKWLRGRNVDGIAYTHTSFANVYLRANKRLPLIRHAMRGLLGWHPSWKFACKLLAEGLLGERIYGFVASVLKP